MLYFAGDHLWFTEITEIVMITWNSIISWLHDRSMLSG